MKKIFCLLLLLMVSIFADCIDITENTRLDADNSSCFIITEEEVVFDCNSYFICEDGGNTCITIDAKEVIIKNCFIEGDSRQTGIRINEDKAELRSISINNSRNAVYLYNADNCFLKDLEISNSDTGIYIRNSNDLEINGANIQNTDAPISISSSSNLLLKNIFVENEDYEAYYIRFKVETKDGDSIKDAEVTLENSEGEYIFRREKTDEKGYTEWGEAKFFEDGDFIFYILTITYGDEEYEDDHFEIMDTETIVIELDVEIEEELAKIGDSCEYNEDCQSGYCCLQGEYEFTCRFGPAFCISHECMENSDCKKTEKCQNNKCIEIIGECGYADNHKWIDYECCEDSDCKEFEYCKNNECVKVECECGEIENHKCIAECCKDRDCGEGFKCIDMVCVPGNACNLDEECKHTEECFDGFCEEITGICGYAFNHRWISFECCSDSDCSEGECINNVCMIKDETKGGICASAFIFLSIFLFIKFN